MSGKGLESLIPKRDEHGSTQGSSFFDDASEEYTREEREGLGVLSNLSDSSDKGDEKSEKKEESSSYSTYTPQPRESEVREEEQETLKKDAMGPIFQIEVEKIIINPYQPRKTFDQEALSELAISIGEYGILQPLVVEKKEKETEFGTRVSYQLIAGHRRLLAAKKAGLKTVPVIVRAQSQGSGSLEMAIVENIQRKDLSSIETARAYARLSDEFGMTQREIASKLGKSRESVANTLRLLSLPSEIQDALIERKISESVARLLLQIPDSGVQKELFLRASERDMSVREFKKQIQLLSKEKEEKKEQEPSLRDVHMERLERELSETFGAPVRVEQSQKGGKIIIHFYSSEEIDGILSRIKRDEF